MEKNEEIYLIFSVKQGGLFVSELKKHTHPHTYRDTNTNAYECCLKKGGLVCVGGRWWPWNVTFKFGEREEGVAMCVCVHFKSSVFSPHPKNC